GFPLSGVIATDAIAASKPWSNPSASSSSYGGNPLASAAGLAALETIVKEDLVTNAERVGKVMLTRLEALKEKYRCVGEVRGRWRGQQRPQAARARLAPPDRGRDRRGDGRATGAAPRACHAPARGALVRLRRRALCRRPPGLRGHRDAAVEPRAADPGRARSGPPRALREAARPFARRPRVAAGPGGGAWPRAPHGPQLASCPDRAAHGHTRARGG